MSRDSSFEKIEASLYLSESEAVQKLTPTENERRRRWVFCISKRMDDPLIPDKMLVEQLQAGYAGIFDPVSQSTAYRDIACVNKLVGNIQLGAKNWYRYMIIEGAKKAYAIAEQKQDGKAMAAALDKIGKYTMADKPDNDVDWSQLVPPVFEPSADPDLLENIEPVDDLEERRRQLRSLFKGEMQREAIDAEIEIEQTDNE